MQLKHLIIERNELLRFILRAQIHGPGSPAGIGMDK